MIRKLHIRNFKSVVDLEMELGRVNVLIGENGSGKSNILEAIAFAAAAAGNKLDNEFLASRGIRATESKFMRSAFTSELSGTIVIRAMSEDGGVKLDIRESKLGASDRSSWQATKSLRYHDPINAKNDLDFKTIDELNSLLAIINKLSRERDKIVSDASNEVGNETAATLNSTVSLLVNAAIDTVDKSGMFLDPLLGSFLIYAPENSALRTFEREGQILPLGIRGEGLFKLLYAMEKDSPDAWAELRENLSVLDWFDDLSIGNGLAPFEQRLQIKDRFLADGGGAFDQRSSNEGFLFLLFYFALFISRETPGFFAIDNVDTSLNPKTCRELMRRLAVMAAAHDKQAIFTTHNPSVLDGLDLHDDEQRLFVISRTRDGHTRARRVLAPQPVAGEPPVKLSEAFTGGLLGGLPKNF